MTVVFTDEEWAKFHQWVRDLGTDSEQFSFQFVPETGECIQWTHRVRSVVAIAHSNKEPKA